MVDTSQTRSWNFSSDEPQKEILVEVVLNSREV
jgi:hypothetical protein